MNSFPLCAHGPQSRQGESHCGTVVMYAGMRRRSTRRKSESPTPHHLTVNARLSRNTFCHTLVIECPSPSRRVRCTVHFESLNPFNFRRHSTSDHLHHSRMCRRFSWTPTTQVCFTPTLKSVSVRVGVRVAVRAFEIGSVSVLLRQATWQSFLKPIVLLLYCCVCGANAKECIDAVTTCKELTAQYGCGTYWPTYPVSGGEFVGYACRKTCGLCSFPMTGPNYKVQNDALKALYSSTGGDHWVDNSFWLNQTVGHCEWSGVSQSGSQIGVFCDRTGNITALSVPHTPVVF